MDYITYGCSVEEICRQHLYLKLAEKLTLFKNPDMRGDRNLKLRIFPINYLSFSKKLTSILFKLRKS
jgi:hypothetical protein